MSIGAVNNSKGEKGVPVGGLNFVAAIEAGLATRPEYQAVRAKALLDEQMIYNTLAKELYEETVVQNLLADRHGITLPADAGEKAINTLANKYFMKMERDQLLDTFRNLTSRISNKRREDPDYKDSALALYDYYWVLALLFVMHKKMYLDDPQGIPEKDIVAGLEDAGLSGDEMNKVKTLSGGNVSESGVNLLNDAVAFLGDYLSDATQRAGLKIILGKIGITADMLSGASLIGPEQVRTWLDQANHVLTPQDFHTANLESTNLNTIITATASASTSYLNTLKSLLID